MTNTYAIIENYSGFVWSVQVAADPIAACRQMDETLGAPGRAYEEGGVADLRTTAAVYDVRLAPAGFDVDDGQDPAQIAAVEALPRAAVILTRDAED